MVPEEWPIAAQAADPPVESPRPRGRGRLASVRRDFFLDPAERLTEQERALMTAMLHDQVGSLVVQIIALLPATRDLPDTVEIANVLSASGLLDRPGLVELLLRRADEHRIAAAFTGRAGPRRLPLVSTLVSDDRADIASAAMELVVARGRRRDAFGQPRIELSDLSAEDAMALAHAVAAHLAVTIGYGDQALLTAVDRILGERDEQKSLDATLNAFAAALLAARLGSDELIAVATAEGEAALLAHLLAHRAGIDPDTAWDHIVHAGEGRLALLARMAGLKRATAARILADLGGLTGAPDAEEEIVRFDTLTDADVRTARSFWVLPDGYRAAREALGGDRG